MAIKHLLWGHKFGIHNSFAEGLSFLGITAYLLTGFLKSSITFFFGVTH
jgi:hypothetical protein